MQESLFVPTTRHELNTHISLDKGVLKSGLQKAIRQNKVNEAVRIAKSFMALDPTECLRRLPVITLEDVTLHADIDELVAIYRRSSKKDYVLTDDERNLVLNYVYQIAGSEWRDNFWKNNPDGQQVPDLTKLTDKMKSISEAVEYRASAGGLAEDPPMMRHQLRAWQYRWTVKEMGIDDVMQFFPESPNLDWNDVEYAQVQDIPLNAFDFHIIGQTFNKLIAQKPYVKSAVLSEYPNSTDSQIQFTVMNMVWRNWVALNVKKQILSGRTIDWFIDDGVRNAFPESEREKMERIWLVMAEDVENLSKWVCKKRTGGQR
jgi:hypothetical protein